jgi:hypothetical protein
MLDGLSAEKLLSLNSSDKNALINQNCKTTFLDGIFSRSLCFTHLYGTGETFATLAPKLTGETLLELKADNWFHPSSFVSNNNISNYFKREFNCRNIFYRNYSTKYPLTGVYARFNSTCTDGFDKVIIQDDSRVDLKDSEKVVANEDYFELSKINQNTFIFIHDLYLHDSPEVNSGNNIREYEKAVEDSAQHVKRNLQYLQFNEKQDILIFSSDHGLTLFPELGMFVNKETTEEEYMKYRRALTSELKVRAFLAIYYNTLPPQMVTTPILSQDVYRIVKNMVTNIQKKRIDLVNAEVMKFKNRTVITSVADLVHGNPTPLRHRQKHHSHILYVSSKDKWIYTKWPREEVHYVDLDKEEIWKSVAVRSQPKEMRKYTRKYFSCASIYQKRTGAFFDKIYQKIRRIVKRIIGFAN